MSLFTAAGLFDRYGPRLTMEELAEVLKLETRVTIYNQINAGTFPIKTYKDGRGRFADYQDVAAYLEQCREKAA